MQADTGVQGNKGTPGESHQGRVFLMKWPFVSTFASQRTRRVHYDSRGTQGMEECLVLLDKVLIIAINLLWEG